MSEETLHPAVRAQDLRGTAVRPNSRGLGKPWSGPVPDLRF